MDNKLYKLMNWPEIESVVYSECKYPQNILGCHEVSNGHLVQCFFPGAESVNIVDLKMDEKIEMECVDEEGFFALFVPGKSKISYEYSVTYQDGTKIVPEVYGYIPSFWGDLSGKLNAGILYDSYRYFGAHFVERKGVLGTEFITYAPNAERVSVVGDFNGWDGRIHQMCLIDEIGVYGIFIPGINIGSLYKFEIKMPGGLTFLKRDPYAFELEKGEGDACVVAPEPDYDKNVYKRTPLSSEFSILNVGLNELLADTDTVENMSAKLIKYVKDNDYDAVLLSDLTKCDFKSVTDNGTVSFYALNPSLLKLKDFKAGVKALHNEKIKVFVSVEPSGFTADNDGLRGYDGTRIFEGEESEISGRLSFDFSKPYVRNYLISACDYFVNVLDADGLCIGGVDRILYLDYGKFDGEWIPNIYGGNENLNGEEFIKHLNSILHKRYPGLISIARDSMVSNTLTVSLDEGGLGFDYKIHTQFDKDLVRYMENDVNGRHYHHTDLTYSPVYIYCEKFILSLLWDDYTNSEDKLLSLFPFDDESKYSNLRLLIGYMYMHPGRKCLPFTHIKDAKLNEMILALNKLYKERAELSESDSPEGFEWVNAIDSERSVISFVRKSKDKELFVIANFSDKPINYRVGVKEGEYKEIFANEQMRFGGRYKLSGRSRQTSKVRCDGKEDSLSVKLAPFGLHIFEKL